MFDFPQELQTKLRLKILRSKEILEKSQKIEWRYSKACILLSTNKNFVELLENWLKPAIKQLLFFLNCS